MLDAANDQLYAYQRVSDDIHTQLLVHQYGLAQKKVIQQVDEIANAAAHICTGVEDFKEDISSFLDLLHKYPDTWATAKVRIQFQSALLLAAVSRPLCLLPSVSLQTRPQR
jgi:hypothetical protein